MSHEDLIRALVDQAPPLSASQRDRLSAILRQGATDLEKSRRPADNRPAGRARGGGRAA
jgi:hypothetical protein